MNDAVCGKDYDAIINISIKMFMLNFHTNEVIKEMVFLEFMIFIF